MKGMAELDAYLGSNEESTAEVVTPEVILGKLNAIMSILSDIAQSFSTADETTEEPVEESATVEPESEDENNG